MGCRPWGPSNVLRLFREEPWQTLHSEMTPVWPCNWLAVTLSLARGLEFGHSAWVAPWQASQKIPALLPSFAVAAPWLLTLTRYSLGLPVATPEVTTSSAK